MSRERLHLLLDELHRELAAADALDDTSRQDLLALAEAVRVRSAEPRGPDEPIPDDEGEGLREQLKDQVQQFEASHPKLARVLANLIDTLALYGI